MLHENGDVAGNARRREGTGSTVDGRRAVQTRDLQRAARSRLNANLVPLGVACHHQVATTGDNGGDVAREQRSILETFQSPARAKTRSTQFPFAAVHGKAPS